MRLISSAFEEGGEIPAKYTCEGEDISVPLSWSEIPSTTKSLALIIEDPDAPDPNAPKMLWIHWVLFNLDPARSALPENFSTLDLNEGVGLSSWNKLKYGGPCPPIGRHRYFHRLYALNTTLQLHQPTADALKEAMRGHLIDEAVLIGTYQKKK